MFSVCCTAKLLKRTGFHPAPVVPDPTTALGNWHANILFFYRAQLLLFVNDNSRLAVVTPAREVRSLASHLTNHLAELLEQLGVPSVLIDTEMNAMVDARFATSTSKSVLGTMNDYGYQMEAFIDRSGEIVPLEIALFLSGCPAGPLQYATPKEVALKLLKSWNNPGRNLG